MNKTMTCKLLGAALMAGGLLTASAQAATVLVDFGRPDNETTAAADTYNNPHLDPTDPPVRQNAGDWDSGVLGLVDTSNAATPWSIQIETVAAGEAAAKADVAAAPATIMAFADTAWKDHFFIQDEGTATVSITGLNDALTYDLLFFGSRKGSVIDGQTWSLTKGSGGSDVTHDPANTTTVVDWDGISTDGNGEIEFTIAASGGSAGLSFGQITEVPEPSSLALIGLGGLCVLRRRRR